MKKLALLLAAVLVLSLGTAVLAAEVKVGGEVKYTIESAGGDPTYTLSWKVNASGSVTDQLGFAVGVKSGSVVNEVKINNNGTPNDPKDDYPESVATTTAAVLDKANFTLQNFGAPFSVTVGKDSLVTGRLNALETVDLTNFYGFEGINIKTSDLSGFTGQLLLDPTKKDAMVKVLMLDYKAAFGEFGLNYQPAQVSGGQPNMAVEASVPIPNSPVSAYLQYTKLGDADGFIMGGASATFSGVTVYAETSAEKGKEATAYGLSGSVFGGTWSIDVMSPQGKQSTTTLAYKVAF